MAAAYGTIPTKEAFEKDSWLLTGRRSNEHQTLQVDAALAAYHAAAKGRFEQQLALVLLFGAIDRWLKHVDAAAKGGGSAPGADKGRRAAMYELYKVVVQQLTLSTGVPVNMLPNWLQVTFGRDMSTHGIDLDVKQGLSKTLTASELERYRLHFKGGLAYQTDWWATGS